MSFSGKGCFVHLFELLKCYESQIQQDRTFRSLLIFYCYCSLFPVPFFFNIGL